MRNVALYRLHYGYPITHVYKRKDVILENRSQPLNIGLGGQAFYNTRPQICIHKGNISICRSLRGEWDTAIHRGDCRGPG